MTLFCQKGLRGRPQEKPKWETKARNMVSLFTCYAQEIYKLAITIICLQDMLWLCVLGCTDDRLPNEDFLLP